MRAKLVENLNSQFNFDYFNLPYQIPEDRFDENGLVIGSNEREKLKRNLKKDYSQLQYKSVEDYFEKVNLAEIQTQVDSDIKEVSSFISNNPLTKNLLTTDYHQEYSLKEYLKEYYSDEGAGWDAHIGWINCELDMGILVDYDIYKGKTVFTFIFDTMMYYYKVYTLGKNNVIGYGEEHTYITVNDFKNQMFYETICRFLFQQATWDEELEEILNIDYADAENKSDLNFPRPVVDNYFKPEFFQALQILIS